MIRQSECFNPSPDCQKVMSSKVWIVFIAKLYRIKVNCIFTEAKALGPPSTISQIYLPFHTYALVSTIHAYSLQSSTTPVTHIVTTIHIPVLKLSAIVLHALRDVRTPGQAARGIEQIIRTRRSSFLPREH